MANISTIFGGAFIPPADRVLDPPEIQFADAMQETGFTPPDQIIMDGKIHRFSTGGKRDKSAWYILFGGDVPAGTYGDWRGDTYHFKADIGRRLTDAEQMIHVRRMAEAKAIRDADLAKTREVASSVVDQIWAEGKHAEEYHPYLKRKGIKPNGARVTGDGRLMLPLFDSNGELSSLQYIADDGDKKYHPGGATGGMFWTLGSLENASRVYIAEGFATAATIHDDTNDPVGVTYSADNIVAVVGSFRENIGKQADIVIVADNDDNLEEKLKNAPGEKFNVCEKRDENGIRYIEYTDSVGLVKKIINKGATKAYEAAKKYSCSVVLTPSPIGASSDINDYSQLGHSVKDLLNPPQGEIFQKMKAIYCDQLSDEYYIPDELIENLMTIGSLSVIYGDSNSGKTFFALSMAAAVASGTECYGRKTDPGLVIYLATESPSSVITRIQAIKKYYGYNLANLVVVPIPINFYSGDGDANDVIALVKAVEEEKNLPVRLIFGDTLARMSAGANENSGEDMGPVMARFDKVAQATGAALGIIHHNGKNAAAGARGWSGIRAHIDTEIEVTCDNDIRMATVTKQRELPGKGESIYFKLHIMEMGIGKFGNAATTCVAIQDDDVEEKKEDEYSKSQLNNISLFNRAWYDTKSEIVYSDEGYKMPYVSRSALRSYFEKQGDKKQTIDNKLNENDDKKFLGILLSSNIIKPISHGYGVCDPLISSHMLLSKTER